ncbi:MAG: serine hydrolase [Verrucomicrobiales bacterium]
MRLPGLPSITRFSGGGLFGTDFGTAPYTANERALTIREVLQHVAGWPNDGKLWHHDETASGSNNGSALGWRRDNVSQVTPGTVGRYSNLGFTIAARAVEYLSGEGFEPYVTNNLIAPSGYSGIFRPVIGDRGTRILFPPLC